MAEKLMTFTEHLIELRRRLKRIMLYIVGTTLVAYAFRKTIFALMAQPLVKAWTEANLGEAKIHFANPIEPFFTYLKISMIAGIFAASPLIFYEIWGFVAPGLYKTEKRYVIPFTTISAVFFLGGASFGYFFVFPYAFQFFLGFATGDMGFENMPGLSSEMFKLQPTLMMGEYFGLIWRLLLAFGVIFELPLVVFFLSMVGIVDYRQLWRFNRYFVILSFLIGAALTPPDIVTQVFMAGPLVVLYNLAILASFIFTRKRVKEQDRLKAEAAAQEKQEAAERYKAKLKRDAAEAARKQKAAAEAKAEAAAREAAKAEEAAEAEDDEE